MKDKTIVYLIKQIVNNYWLLILFVISIIIIFLCILKPITVNLPTEIIHSINDAFLAVATGYASGYFIFLLSVLLPRSIRMSSILDITKESFRYARDEIGGIFLDKGGSFKINKKSVIELIPYLTVSQQKEDWYVTDEKILTSIHRHITKANSYLHDVIPQSEYYDSQDLEEIKSITKIIYNIESRLSGRLTTIEEIDKSNFDKREKEQMKQNVYLFHKGEIIKIAKDMQRLFEIFNHLFNKYVCVSNI